MPGGASGRLALHERGYGVDGAEVLLVELVVLDGDAELVLEKGDELDRLKRGHHAVLYEELVVGDVAPARHVLLQPAAYRGPGVRVVRNHLSISLSEPERRFAIADVIRPAGHRRRPLVLYLAGELRPERAAPAPAAGDDR